MRISGTAVILALALPLGALAAPRPQEGDPGGSGAWLHPIMVAFSAGAFDDSTGVEQVNPRLVAAFSLPREGQLALGVGVTRVGREARGDADSTLGATISAPPWHAARASVSYALHASGDGARHEAEARVRLVPSPSFQAGVAVRHRPFVDVVPALAVDDQLFHDAGPGGASDPRAAASLGVDELRLAASGSPLRGTYAYTEARNLHVDDGNDAWTLSAGVGVNLTRALGAPLPLDLTARWDVYGAWFDRVAPAYYSPGAVVSHTPGGEVRRRLGRLELALEGGYTFASDGSRGWLAGALASLRAGRFSAALRAQVRDDPWYTSRRVWLAVERAL